MTDSQTCLPIGTEVVVQGKRGIVVKSKMVPAHSSGIVSLHKIQFTHKRENRKWKLLERLVTKECNYAFIEVYSPPLA